VGRQDTEDLDTQRIVQGDILGHDIDHAIPFRFVALIRNVNRHAYFINAELSRWSGTETGALCVRSNDVVDPSAHLRRLLSPTILELEHEHPERNEEGTQALGKVNTDTTGISKALSGGITITKLPSTTGKLSGSVKVNF
jgi:hypothetical protein